jgi:carboxylesterase type B
LHGDDIEYTFFNGDTSTPDLGGGTVNATVAGVRQDIIVDFAETGSPNGKGVPEFPDYGNGEGKVLDLNVTALGRVMEDANNNVRCKYWQEAAWT